MYSDKTLTCVDCGDQFTFTVKEQEFYAEKGFASEPRRCSNCRAARKAQRGDSPSGGGSRTSSSGGGGARELHNVTCSQCGTETQVPFKPSGDRPVYCRDCFQQRA